MERTKSSTMLHLVGQAGSRTHSVKDHNQSTKETPKEATKETKLQKPTEEEMEVIRKVFIPEYDWKPEQVPYLKNILKL